ncbi:unnamed protein product [Paramecium primaurelia]|uniref:non-specific serine/threonine protein kinase n=1 Tax=Paramecium primaurelia TaxID=5886 RepID=A0A8S1PB58_PARPR|nr:unnamed protein product [Paramecium primaurelia]
MLHQFQELEKLGAGSFSEVWKVMRRADHQIYAMKKIKMGTLNEKEKQNALNEIRLLASLNQEFIIGYKEALYIEETQTLGIIMEYAEGGDIAKQITNKQNKTQKFQEQEIWQALIQITQGLKELHEKLIFHRDVKSANIFISNGIYKLGDLNVSKIAQRGLLYTQTGTPYYASPEIWRDEPYDNKSDIWSLGCVLYEMCNLHPPFQALDMEGLYKKIQKGLYPPINGYSNQLVQLIGQMLRLNASARPSCDQILNSNLMNSDFSRLYIKTPNIAINKRMMKTIQLPKNLSTLNDILPIKKYYNENKENENESVRYSVQTSKLMPLNRKSVNNSCIEYEKRFYRISSVHEEILPTLPSEYKQPKVLSRRRPSSQYKEEEINLERRAEAIISRKQLQKQLSEQHPLPKPILKKQMSNLPYLYRNVNDSERQENNKSKYHQSPNNYARRNIRKQITSQQ